MYDYFQNMEWIRNFIYALAFRMMDFIDAEGKEEMLKNELKRQERKGEIISSV